MAEEIAFENSQISNFEELMTVTLTLDHHLFAIRNMVNKTL